MLLKLWMCVSLVQVLHNDMYNCTVCVNTDAASYCSSPSGADLGFNAHRHHVNPNGSVLVFNAHTMWILVDQLIWCKFELQWPRYCMGPGGSGSNTHRHCVDPIGSAHLMQVHFVTHTYTMWIAIHQPIWCRFRLCWTQTPSGSWWISPSGAGLGCNAHWCFVDHIGQVHLVQVAMHTDTLWIPMDQRVWCKFSL